MDHQLVIKIKLGLLLGMIVEDNGSIFISTAAAIDNHLTTVGQTGAELVKISEGM